MVGVISHVQSIKNNKFAVSLYYFKKKVRDKNDFLLRDKHQSFLQAGSIIFTGHSYVSPKYPKQQVSYIFAISQKKRGMKLSFCIQINIKLSYRLVLLILLGMSKLPKIASLQNLFDVSRKTQGMKLNFVLMSIKILLKLMLSFLMDMAKHV